MDEMAEGEGFEPPDDLHRQQFSRLPLSTAQPSLRVKMAQVTRLGIHSPFPKNAQAQERPPDTADVSILPYVSFFACRQ